MPSTNPIARAPALHVVVYHYVRELQSSDFPRLKALPTHAFGRQLNELKERYEMATLQAALEFLSGAYQPERDLCLLTFDDGLKEHHRDVTPILVDEKVQGVFFVPTFCLEHDEVLAVHKNHFLMAHLELGRYQESCSEWLRTRACPADWQRCRERGREIYRWDSVEAAALKYLLNYELQPDLRNELLRDVFYEHLGDEGTFARQLYLNWDEARQMQSAGMVIGGHSHRHLPLALLDVESQREDLQVSFGLLRRHLEAQRLWPFAYPYGTPSSHSSVTQRLVQEAGFACGFTTECGKNAPQQPRYALRRWDTNDMNHAAAWKEGE
jgi:peptidoglycan/xylan/chitin deacetylase (PgdA/CDA1 family)